MKKQQQIFDILSQTCFISLADVVCGYSQHMNDSGHPMSLGLAVLKSTHVLAIDPLLRVHVYGTVIYTTVN